MSNWKHLEEDLIRFRDISGLIRIQLLAYIEPINNLIKDISQVEFINTSEKFDNLYTIQSQIATVLYKYNFDLPEILDDFVRNFDRDDEYARKYWYEKFKAGYTLNNPCCAG